MHGRQVHEVPAFQRRLDRQADATRHLRLPLYERFGLAQARSILDVGCGSGAVTRDLQEVASSASVVACDADALMTRRARETLGDRPLGGGVIRADGGCLPFADDTFDVVACNLVLLWATDPQRLLNEMARVVRPGGLVVASMEPDYGGKVHWPANPLIDLVFRGEGVRKRGGDPHSGRKLRERFRKAGLEAEVGILNPTLLTPDQDLQLFRTNRSYYRRLLAESGFAQTEIERWEEEYLESLFAGDQLSHLPLFYAVGQKPGTNGAPIRFSAHPRP